MAWRGEARYGAAGEVRYGGVWLGMAWQVRCGEVWSGKVEYGR